MIRAALGVGTLRVAVVTLAAAAGALLAGCGQKGALYLPEASGEVVTRPMQTPEASPSPGDSETAPAPSEPKKPAAPPAIPPATP